MVFQHQPREREVGARRKRALQAVRTGSETLRGEGELAVLQGEKEPSVAGVS